MDTKKTRRVVTPNIKILIGFALIILIGTLLLMLPISASDMHSIGFVNALFTSTSCVCVTGLSVVDTAITFSIFGKIVMLLLIQVGGLGIVTLTSFVFLLIGKKINLNNRIAIQESLNKDSIQGVVKFIKKVIIVTFAIEAVGAIMLLYSCINITHSVWYGIFCAIFLSVASFCNAGFDTLGMTNIQFASLTPYATNTLLLLPIMLLIVLGGIGFVILLDHKKQSRQHVRVVLYTTIVLLLIGFATTLIFEWNNPNTIGNMNVWNKIVNSLFQSVTARTAGFASINQNALTAETKIVTMLLMFIGASPNSTGGGIKTTTLFVLLLFMFRHTNENGDINLRKRRVSGKIIQKALRITLYAIFVTAIGASLIRIFEGNNVPIDSILFECISAISTTGLSTGITPTLSIASKTILIVLMYVGRVGLTTVALAIVPKNTTNTNITYQNTDIIVG